MILEVKGNNLYFAKLKEGAKIPTKETENAGFDIYACFDKAYIEILKGETMLIPTGICSAFSEDYVAVLKERGSTGTKGMSQKCGVIDSGYRNEWFVPINNTSDKTIIIAKNVEAVRDFIIQRDAEFSHGSISLIEQTIDDEYTFYPYSKAITQVLLVPVPKMKVNEIPAAELQSIPSKRGLGNLGSSGK